MHVKLPEPHFVIFLSRTKTPFFLYFRKPLASSLVHFWQSIFYACLYLIKLYGKAQRRIISSCFISTVLFCRCSNYIMYATTTTTNWRSRATLETQSNKEKMFLYPSVSFSLYLSVSVQLSVYLAICLYLSFSPSFCLSLSLIYLCVSFTYRSICLCLSVSVFLYLYVSIYLYFSLSFSLQLSSICLLFLSFFLSLSLFLPHLVCIIL